MDTTELLPVEPKVSIQRQHAGMPLPLGGEAQIRQWHAVQASTHQDSDTRHSAQSVQEVCGLLSMDKRITIAHSSILEAIKLHFNDPARIQEFEENLYSFEARAQTDGNSLDQVRKTYQDLYMILNDDQVAAVPRKLKVKFVEQWAQNLADPVHMVSRTRAKQVASHRRDEGDDYDYAVQEIVEIRRNPEILTKAIAQALTNQRIEVCAPAISGRKVSLTIGKMSLQPDLEASEQSGLPEARRYADQIAQLVIKNINRKMRDATSLGWSSESGKIRYN